MPKISLSSKWSCDGRELKPKVGAKQSDIWVTEGNKIKPKISANYDTTYELNGNAILVAFCQVVLKLW